MNRALPTLFFVCCGFAASAFAAAPDRAPSVLVDTVPLRKGSLARVISVYGTVRPDRAAFAGLMAPIAAVVTAVHVRVGERVAAGAPLVTLAPSPQTAAAYAQAVSALRVARDALKRTRQLAAQSLATGQQVAAAGKARSDAAATLAALRAQGAAGPTAVRAPYAAVVTAVAAVTHSLVAEGAPLVDLARPNGLVFAAGVVPADASAIRAGDQAQVTPIGGTRSVAGRVVLRGAVIDPMSGLVPVTVALPTNAMMPGQSALAAIKTDRVAGFVVPHAAILVHDNGDPYVVQAQRMAAKFVPVRVLLSAGASDVVAGTLDPAAPLVLAGNYQLDDGMKLRFTNPKTPAVR